MWVIFAACLLLAGFVGSLLVKARKLGISILAGWGGVLLGFILTTTFVIESNYIYWAIVGACAIVCAYAAFKIEKLAIMLATALIGGYLFVRGISLYAGGFPNESSLQAELQSGALSWNTFPKSFYGYFAGIIVFTLLSVMYQRKHDMEEQKKIAALEENKKLLEMDEETMTIEQKKEL